jgi:hypothetical protein
MAEEVCRAGRVAHGTVLLSSTVLGFCGRGLTVMPVHSGIYPRLCAAMRAQLRNSKEGIARRVNIAASKDIVTSIIMMS